MSRPASLPDWPRAMKLDLAAAYVSLGPSTWLREVDEGRAPKPIPLTVGRVGWLRDHLDAWLERQAAQAEPEPAEAQPNPWDAP